MADIGASAAMQLQQGLSVMVQGPNGQQQLHYISLAALQGTSQQQQLPAWPVIPMRTVLLSPTGIQQQRGMLLLEKLLDGERSKHVLQNWMGALQEPAQMGMPT